MLQIKLFLITFHCLINGVFLQEDINVNIDNIFPYDHSLIYAYQATVDTGTKKPEKLVSQWNVTAGLVINSSVNYSIVQFIDIRISTYNGLESNNRDTYPHSVTNLDTLTEPFIIDYKNGLVNNIRLNSTDEVWVSNIKRAIASLLQLDVQEINKGAFISEEKNIYGSCFVEYNIENNTRTNTLNIRKFLNHNKCTNAPFHSWSNAPVFECPSKHQNSVISSSERDYEISIENDTFVIKLISAHGGLFLQPFEAYGDAHYTESRQLLTLQKIKKHQISIENRTNLTHSDITYEQNILDFTSGRRKLTKQDKITAVKDGIEKLTNSFEEYHSVYKINKLHRATLQMLYFQLRTLDISELHQIYSDIGLGTSYEQETKANIFHELLPQIGSEASTEFIKELILSRNIKDMTAVKLLSTLPFYIENSNDNLLQSFEPFLILGKEFSVNVRQTAILSFATLVHKTYLAKKCSIQTFEKYVRKYIDYFADSNTYEKQMLYLQGLNNLEFGSVKKFLTPVISKGSPYSQHIRFLAVWATMSSAPSNSDEIYKIYWPILEDRTESLEMRVAAFLMLLTSEPTTGRLLSLYWFMQKEKNPHLYNFYYTTLQSMQYTTYPCYLKIGALASQIIRFVTPPATKKYWVTGNYLFDYNDAERGFGSMLQLFLIGNSNTDRLNVFHFTLNNYVMGRNINQFSVYLKLQGVAESILDKITATVSDQTSGVEDLVNILQDAKFNLKLPDPVHIEILAKFQGKTIFSQYVNETTFNLLAKALMDIHDLKSAYHVNYQHIGITLATRELYPSDMGTPIWISSSSGALASVRGNFTHVLDDSVLMRKNDLDFRYSFQSQHTLFSYNPILDAYHGIERQKVVHGIFPLIMNIHLDVAQWKLTTSFRQGESPHSSILLHTRSLSFYRTKDNSQFALNTFCPHCRAEYELAQNNRLENKELLKLESRDLSGQLQLSIFNCDSPFDIKKIYQDVSQSHRTNHKVLPFSKYLLELLHYWDYLSFIPTAGRCGAALTVESLNGNNPMIYWIIKIENDNDLDISQILNQEKIIIYTKILHKHENTITKIINVILRLEGGSDQDYFQIKLNIDRKIDNVTEKLCLHSNIKLPIWNSDMFSYEPIDAIQAIGNMTWGEIKQNEICSNDRSMYWNITGELTEEQKLELELASKWPFKQCKNMSNGLKFTPLSEECYRASLYASTPRKYMMSFYFEKMPDWFENNLKRVQYLLQFLEPTNSDLNITSDLNIKFEYVEKEKLVKILYNKQVINIRNINAEDITPFLPSVRFPSSSDLAVNLGLINSCLITKTAIVNIYNISESLNFENNTFLALGDCSVHPKFALFISKIIDDNLVFKFYNGNNFIMVKRDDNKTIIQVNDETIDATNGFYYPTESRHYDFKIFHRDRDVIEIDSKFSRTWLHYTEEYIIVTTPGFYKGQLCGKCT